MKNTKPICLLLSVLSIASLSATTQAQVPLAFTYNGRLELDGVPQNRRFDMEFIIRDVDDIDLNDEPLWNEIFEGENGIQVTEGSFSKTLISADFASLFSSNTTLYLGIKVKPQPRPGEEEVGWVSLDPMKELVAVPFAIAASRGNKFVAEGDTLDAAIDSNVALTVKDDSNTLRMDGNDISSNRILNFQRHENNSIWAHTELVAKDGLTVEQGAFEARSGMSVRGSANFVGNDDQNLSIARTSIDLDTNRTMTEKHDDSSPLKVKDGNNRILRVDGDAIDSTSTLLLQSYGGDVQIGNDDPNTERGADLIVDKGDIQIGGGGSLKRKNADGTIAEFLKVEGPFTENYTNTGENNSNGSDEREIGASSRRICFLSRVVFESIGDDDEIAECDVYINDNNMWELQARINDSDNGEEADASAYCQARCLSW